MRSIRSISVVAASAGLTLPVVGQVESLEPVEQAIEDIASLSISLREIEPGLRQPARFGKVYRVPGHPDEFMRVQGALYAVFPRSVYAFDEDRGLVPVVPSGTVFYIGSLPDAITPVVEEAAGNPDRIGARIDLRIDHHALFEMAPEASQHLITRPAGPRVATEPIQGGAIANDPTYRTVRLRSLLRRAAENVKVED